MEGVTTLAQVVDDVDGLLDRLTDLLVPDFANVAAAATADGAEWVASTVRPEGDEARRLLAWIADGEWNEAGSAAAPQMYLGEGRGLSVIVAPIPAGGSSRVLVVGRRADRETFATDDLDFIARVVSIVIAEGSPAEGSPAEGSAWRLQRLTARLSEALTPAQVAESAAEYLRSALDASAVWVGLLDTESATRLELSYSAGFPAEVRQAFDRVLVEDTARPLAATVNRNTPMWFTNPDAVVDGYEVLKQLHPQAGSMALLPLSADGHTHGGMGLCRDRPGGFSANKRGEALAMTTLTAQALERASRYAIAQQVAATLQQSLLPRVPEVADLAIYTRYLPAASEVQVGGDWYDVVPLSDGRVGLVVGDVAGHGVSAAAAMGQLRTGLQAYLREGHEPGAVLQRTDALTGDLSPTQMTTVWCGVLEPASGRLRYATAGHVAPVVVDPERGVEFLNSPRNPPVGIGWRGRFDEGEIELPAGACLICYTDGLIERREESLQDGYARLAKALDRPAETLDALGESLLTLADEGHIDDVAILAIKRERRPVQDDLPLVQDAYVRG